MRCPDAGTLRALLDGELADTVARPLRDHLAGCPGCAEQAAGLTQVQLEVTGRLKTLPEGVPDSTAAYERFRQQSTEHPNTVTNRRPMMTQNTWRRWRPALTGVAIVAVLAVALSTNPGRVLARQFLSMLRVEQVVGVAYDPQELDPEAAARLEDYASAMQPELVTNEQLGEVTTVEEASALAGFGVRVPAALSAGETLTYRVEGRTEYVVRFQREVLAYVLQAAGMDASALPADFVSGEMTAGYTSAVDIAEGGLEIVQVLNPVAEYPEGLDPALFGQAGLRVLGLPAEDAQRIAANLDWATTLLLPVPTTAAEYRDVTVAGSHGTLVVPVERPDEASAQGEGNLPRAALIWQRDGILYLVAGESEPDALLATAESMFQ